MDYKWRPEGWVDIVFRLTDQILACFRSQGWRQVEPEKLPLAEDSILPKTDASDTTKGG